MYTIRYSGTRMRKKFKTYRPREKASRRVLIGIFIGSGIILWNLGIVASLTRTYNRIEGTRRTRNSIEERIASFKKTPPLVKGIYLSSWTAGDPKRRGALVRLVDRTELNTVVVDLKTYEGTVSYPSEVELARYHKLQSRIIPDLREFVAELHRHNIWVIARLPVFQDTVLAEARPDLAVSSKRTGKLWRDRKGLAWVDPSSKEIWEYNSDLAREALHLGFDEVQFDYIRFPSDGDLEDLHYPFSNPEQPKYETITAFFHYLRKSLGANTILSVDLFGLTMIRIDDDDLGIGQRLKDAIPYVNYVSPMVYPSHYQSGFEGFKKPAEKPYEVVLISLKTGAPLFEGKEAKIRPWLQDFDLGAEYTADMVRAQIRATEELEDEFRVEGWLLWNAQNKYTEEALLPELQ